MLRVLNNHADLFIRSAHAPCNHTVFSSARRRWARQRTVGGMAAALLSAQIMSALAADLFPDTANVSAQAIQQSRLMHLTSGYAMRRLWR